jgi:two-component sensor histidine kinase/tetratricopeptide (TPR) repeat protein
MKSFFYFKMKLNKFFIVLCLLFTQVAFASDADTILRTIEQLEDPVEKARNFIKLGDLYEYTDPPKAIGYYSNGYELAKSVSLSSKNKTLSPEADIVMAKCKRYIGIVQSDSGEYDQALESYTASRAILDNLKGTYTSPFRKEILLEFAKLLNNIAQVYSKQSVFSLARDYNVQALEMYHELGDTTSIAVASSSMGIIHARMGNLTEAVKYFQLALEYYSLKQNEEGMAQSFNNIGGIHFQMNSWEEALNLYARSHEIYIKRNQLNRVAATLMNMGLVYHKKGDFNTSMDYLQKSLKIREEISDKAGVVESYNSIGKLLAEFNQYEKARSYYQRAFETASAMGDQRMISLLLINMGKQFELSGNINKGIVNTLEALEVAKQHGFKFSEQQAVKQLSELYAATGDYRKGLEYAIAHFRVSEEILDEQKARQINQLTIEFNAREKQQRIDYLEKEGEYQQVRLRQSKTMLLVLALLFLIVLVLTVFSLVLIKQRNKIMILQKESEARRLINKTTNDLLAILKTHAHGMILFDDELNVVGYNSKAQLWMQKFAASDIAENPDAVRENLNPVIQSLITEIINESMKGFSFEVEKEFQADDQIYHYKFFSNPVFENDEKLIQTVSLMIEDVTDRKSNEKRVLSDLKEKETLIKEIHHRVKNNMQVIISLIRMQSMKFSDSKQIAAFRELEQRITAMSFVHEDLYKSENMSDIKFDDYLQRIAANLVSAYGNHVLVKNNINMQNHFMNIDLAMPCGMIINELITNSLKHAFIKKDKEKEIEVEFIEYPYNYELRVIDNGVGLSRDFNLKNSSKMGLHLVKIIVEEQLRGSWSMYGNDGLKVNITFPKKKQ